MNIKKFGHCCLLIKLGNVTLLTDPGSFSDAQNAVTGIDAILITHEHGDHLHVESVREIMKNNPHATIFTNSGVGKHLDEAGVPYTLLERKARATFKDIPLEAFDCKHEEIFEDFGMVQNTAYLIGEKLFYPGDAFFAPEVPVEVLALPVAGPWCKFPDALRYAMKVKPKHALPVHDGVLREGTASFIHMLAEKILKDKGIAFSPMGDGTEKNFE